MHRGAGSHCFLPAAGALMWLALGCSVEPSPRLADSIPASPWEIPIGELASQRLFRVHYEGPEGKGSFRLTLRLQEHQRYQLAAVDTVGRRLWTLTVEGDEGDLLDHRSKLVCHYTQEIELLGLPLGSMPLASLPALVLGYLPLPPASAVQSKADRLSYRDELERRWSARLGDQRPQQWTLWQRDSPWVWWSRSGATAHLSARQGQRHLRWKEVVREALPDELTRPEVPPDYQVGVCNEPYLP